MPNSPTSTPSAPRCARAALPSFALLLAAACDGPQSALDPAGPAAASIHLLGAVMYVGAAIVTMLVAVRMLMPFFRRHSYPARRNRFLWGGGGVALPGLTLTARVPLSLTTGDGMRAPTTPENLTVEVIGYQYWWEMSYRLSGDAAPVSSANELRLPVGEKVKLLLHAEDVIHSFWVPSLAYKTDMIPGYVIRMVIQADRAGTWRGQCAEFCGAQHARMAFDVVAMPRAEFDAWLAALARPAREPDTPEQREGRGLFIELGCGACHAVRGLSDGRLGPDLTLVGARRSIGSGTLSSGVDNMVQWIARTEQLKPEIRMPSYGHLEEAQLRAVAAYLDSLR